RVPTTFTLSFLATRVLHSFPTRRSSDLEGDLHRLDVAGAACRHLLVRGMRDMSAGIARRRRQDASQMLERRLHAPKATSVRASGDRKSTRLNSSHGSISYAVFCLKKKKP